MMRRRAPAVRYLDQSARVIRTGAGDSSSPLYVDGATGDDGRTKDQARSPSTPWATLGRALWGSTTRSSPNTSQAADAGDTVYVTPGTYSVNANWTSPNSLLDIWYNPANSGTAGNPIRIRSTTGVRDSIVLQNTGTAGVLVGAYNKNYIEWYDIKVRGVDAPSVAGSNTGLLVFIGVTNCGLYNSDLEGDQTYAAGVTGDNYSGVRLNNSRGVVVRNCKLHEFGTTDENQAGMSQYSVADVTVEQNEIWNCGAGYYMKGVDAGDIRRGYYHVRFNYVHDCSWGINAFLTPSSEADPNRIYQNLIKNCTFPFKIERHELDERDVVYTKFLNNTCVGATGGQNVWISGNWMVGGGDTISSITRSGSTATVTTTVAPRLWVSSEVIIVGCNEAAYNGTFTVTAVGATSFTYEVVGTPSTPATGAPLGYLRAEILLQNNIYSGGANQLVMYEQPVTPLKYRADVFELDRNVYHGNTANFCDKPTTDYAALADWVAAVSQDSASITSDPLFVNAASDYHLQGGSPALTLGRAIHGVGGSDGTTIPCGCYITGSETMGLV